MMSRSKPFTHRLVEHIVSTRFDGLPPSAIEQTKTFVLDSLGVALSGTRVPMVNTLKEVAAESGSGREARIWGTGESVPAPTAAFINGYQIHNQEWDCVHEPAVVHPMAVVLSTLLAFAEAESIRQRMQGGAWRPSGADFLTSCVIGVDVAALLGQAAKNKLRFFRPAMCGAFGATAGMAAWLGWDEHQTRSALGLTYSQLSGTMQAHLEGSAVLPMQIGFNTRAALTAIALARRGVQGPVDFLEGPFGYFTLIDPEWESNAIEALGAPHGVCGLSHKPFPSGRATHGGVDGALSLQAEHGFDVTDIKEIRVFAPPLVRQLVDRPPSPGMAASYARLCLPYVVATALLHGTVEVADFERAALDDPSRHALAHKIQVHADGSSAPNTLAPQRVEVDLTDGRSLGMDLAAVLGAPGRPLSRTQHLDKFHRAARSGLRPMSDSSVARLIDLTDHLPDLEDVTVLIDHMTFQS
jgi:2-methylcitrate dehydratase PrpD